MASVARHGSAINQSTASGHVNIRYWNPPYPCGSAESPRMCPGYYDYSTASATINGTVNTPSGTVYANGVRVSINGNSTTETETHNIQSGWEAYGQHYSGTGRVSVGNNRNVYIGNVSTAVVGSNVTTHAGTTTTVRNGSPNVFIGG